MTIKSSSIFEQGNPNGNWERIFKWMDDESVCARDLMAICCGKFGNLPQVRANEIKKNEVLLMVAGEQYKVTIEKC